MKKTIFTFVISLLVFSLYSQSLRTIPYYDWSSTTAFMLSPSPIITGYGTLSDSLSKAHNDSTFYECNGEYYPITCWADYYFWYVNEYWYYFTDPELYEFYYNTKNDYGMAEYICGCDFTGHMHPSRIAVSFPDRYIHINNLSRHKVRQELRENGWEENPNIVANNIENGKNRKSGEKDKEIFQNKRIDDKIIDDKHQNRTIVRKENKSEDINNYEKERNIRDHFNSGNNESKGNDSNIDRNSYLRNNNSNPKSSATYERTHSEHRSSSGGNSSNEIRQTHSGRGKIN